MSKKSPPAPSAKKKRRTNSTQRAAAAAANAAVRAMQDFGPHPMASNKTEIAPPNPSDDNLVASNPFEDTPARSYDIPAGPPPLPPQFTADPTPRRGITPDQIGNMNYMGMRRMQPPNPMIPMNPMPPPPNRFPHPPMMGIHPMSNMHPSNVPPGQVGHMGMNYNNPRQMMNPHMGGASMTGGSMIHPSALNNSRLAMSGPTVLSPMTGLINDTRSSPGIQMVGNRTSPLNQMMGSTNPANPLMNVTGVSPLMSPNHMNTALNVPPITSINSTQPPQHYNQMNSSVGSMQRPPNMPIPGINTTLPGAMMTANNQINNLRMARPFVNAPNMNVVNRNPVLMGPPTGPHVHKTVVVTSASQDMKKSTLMPPPDPPGPIDRKPMGMAPDKIFPPNQPIVFNNQNPNAPPISPCGMCRREVQANEQAVFCESGCNFWFHRRCVGLTEPAYGMLMSEPYAEWVCDKCLTLKNVPLVKYKS